MSYSEAAWTILVMTKSIGQTTNVLTVNCYEQSANEYVCVLCTVRRLRTDEWRVTTDDRIRILEIQVLNELNDADRKNPLNFVMLPLVALREKQSIKTRRHCLYCAFFPWTGVRRIARTYMHGTKTSVGALSPFLHVYSGRSVVVEIDGHDSDTENRAGPIVEYVVSGVRVSSAKEIGWIEEI